MAHSTASMREKRQVLLSEQEWPSTEREQVVSEGEDTDEITTRASDVRKKETLGGNQRRRILSGTTLRVPLNKWGNPA
jgi:hypothetical protein